MHSDISFIICASALLRPRCNGPIRSSTYILLSIPKTLVFIGFLSLRLAKTHLAARLAFATERFAHEAGNEMFSVFSAFRSTGRVCPRLARLIDDFRLRGIKRELERFRGKNRACRPGIQSCILGDCRKRGGLRVRVTVVTLSPCFATRCEIQRCKACMYTRDAMTKEVDFAIAPWNE